ncbi:MAG: amidohydrolase family protein [Candidatus Latescibacterota bacterium]|nr:amidohydrolase family protein [Candidatus Latescibacterota bacterium]
MEIIDTHLHVWSGDYDRYPFAEGRKEAEPAPVELLNETMDQAGVGRAVIVQPIHYGYDNRYVAECVRRFPKRFAAVGLIDQKAPQAPDELERLVDDGFGGLRIHLASRVDDPEEWATPDQDPLWQRAAALGASFCVYGPAQHLSAVGPIIARFPEVKVVLDHIGGAPLDASDESRRLFAQVLGMAEHGNLFIKFTPQGHKSQQPFPHADIHDHYRQLWQAFGRERCMWGTNFPGILGSTGYQPSLDLFGDHLDFLSDQDKEWLFARTAREVWSFRD